MQDTLDKLPPDLARHRVLNTAETAEFCKLSIPHWRRLYRSGRAPHPMRLGTRKLGWRIGDLTDWLEVIAGEGQRNSSGTSLAGKSNHRTAAFRQMA